jgi:hypothetical protein
MVVSNETYGQGGQGAPCIMFCAAGVFIIAAIPCWFDGAPFIMARHGSAAWSAASAEPAVSASKVSPTTTPPNPVRIRLFIPLHLNHPHAVVARWTPVVHRQSTEATIVDVHYTTHHSTIGDRTQEQNREELSLPSLVRRIDQHDRPRQVIQSTRRPRPTANTLVQ